MLLDVRMPGLNGFDTCVRIRESHGPALPVIMLTAFGDPTSVRKGYDAGADDFLQKPIDTPQLVLKVKAFLRLKSLHDESDRSRREAQERARSLALLHEIGRDWSLIAEPAEFHRMVTGRLASLIGAPICSIALYEPVTHTMAAALPVHGLGDEVAQEDPLRRAARISEPLGFPVRAPLRQQPRAAGPAPREGGRAGGGRGLDRARPHDLRERGPRAHRRRQQAGRLHGVGRPAPQHLRGPGRVLPAQPAHLRRPAAPCRAARARGHAGGRHGGGGEAAPSSS